MPTVAELFTVMAFTVLFPLTLSLVKIAVLGVTLPIGVFCIPPLACSVVVATTLVLTVRPFTLVLPPETMVVLLNIELAIKTLGLVKSRVQVLLLVVYS